MLIDVKFSNKMEDGYSPSSHLGKLKTAYLSPEGHLNRPGMG